MTVVAALQFKPQRKRPEPNRQRLLGMIRIAARSGAELVVCPEMCTSGYVFPDPDSVRPYCETRDGPTFQLFSQEAIKGGFTLAYGWAEIDPESGLLYNSATVCFPDREPFFYRKNLLYEADETWAQPGDTPYPVWTTRSGLKTTLGICMDLNDDRFIEHLIEQEIRLCAFPTNWLDQDFCIWNYWAYRLHGTSTCLVAGNSYGPEEHIRFRGESAVLDGRVLLAAAEVQEDDIVMARVPPEPTPFEP